MERIALWGAWFLLAVICLAVSMERRSRQRVAVTLLESEARFRGLFENNHAAMLVTDCANGAIVNVNAAAVAYYGWSREELVRRTIGDITAPSPEPVAHGIPAAPGDPNPLHSRHRRADGSVRDVEVHSGPVQLAGRSLSYSIIHDITERRQAEEALKERKVFVEALLEHAPMGFAVNTIDDGAVVFASRSFASIYGVPPDSIHHVAEFFDKVYLDPAFRERMRERVTADIASGDAARMRWENIPLTTLTGEHKVISASNIPLFDQNLMISTVQDVTERWRAEDAVRESERRFRQVITESPFPIALHAEDGEILHLSQSWCDVTGYTREELKTVADWVERAYGDRPMQAQAYIGKLYELSHQKHEGDHPIRTKSGATRIWEFSTAPLGRLPDGRRLVISMAMDVTERRAAESAARHALSEAGASREVLLSVVEDQRRAEVAQRESEARLKRAQEIAKLGSWTFDRSGRMWWSGELYRIYGVSPESFTPNSESFLDLAHPDDRPAIREWVRACLAREQPGELEFRAILPDGEVCAISGRGELVCDDDGRPTHVSGTAQNITDRVKTEEALRTSLHEKEALLTEVHHRVKNNLQVITSLLRLEAGRSGHAAVKAVLSEMQGRVQSMALLHETLYRSGDLAQVDLSVYLTQLATHLFRSAAPPSGAVVLNLNLASVRIDLDQAIPCGLIVNELISNCLKHAFPAGRAGEVRIALQLVDGGPGLRIEVADTGAGLPADFEARSRESLGLQLVSDLVRQLNATLDIDRGNGTSFCLLFAPKGLGIAPREQR